MSLLDIGAKGADLGGPFITAAPSTPRERADAAWDETFAPDRYFTITAARHDLWQRAIDELHEATGQSFPNPYGPIVGEEFNRPGGVPAVIQDRSQKIILASQQARAAGNDDLFDPENIDRYIAEDARRRRERASSLVGTGSGIAAFLAGAGAETLTPHGLIGLMIPVTRLPGMASAATGVAESFLGNVLREGAFQAGANAALELGGQGLDFASRRQVGSQQDVSDVGLSALGAGVMGFAIGGTMRAIHLKWLGLPEAIRARAPQEVQDAMRIVEADALYGGQNRLGLDPLLHERYQGRANDAIMRGTAPTLDDLARTADTPATALRTILQAEPGSIRAQGMGDALERLRQLPDSELEPLARELLPDAFGRLDKLTEELRVAASVPGRTVAEIESLGRRLTEARQEVGAAVRSALDKITDLVHAEPAPLEVWHGSGAAFDRFDPRHIKSGEGTNMEGPGYYFAAKPEAADAYVGVPNLKTGKRPEQGHLYEAHLNVRPHEMIDWRAPYADLPANVRQAVERLAPGATPKTGEDAYHLLLDHMKELELLRRMPPEIRAIQENIQHATDDQLEKVKDWAATVTDWMAGDVPAARRLYTELGIAGHIYESPRKNVNYVMNPGAEDRIRLVRRNGEELAKALGVETPADLDAMIGRAEALRQSRLMHELLPEGRAAGREPPAVELPREAPKPIAPERLEAMTADARRVLGDKPAPHFREVAAELQAAEREEAGARAAQACVMNGGGIP